MAMNTRADQTSRLYQALRFQPPASSQAWADNFQAGFAGIAGVRMGEPNSLARAAWRAGRDSRLSANALAELDDEAQDETEEE